MVPLFGAHERHTVCFIEYCRTHDIPEPTALYEFRIFDDSSKQIVLYELTTNEDLIADNLDDVSLYLLP